MPTHSTDTFTAADELTSAYTAVMKATKENRKCIVFYAIALKQMKLLRLLTKSKTEAWSGGEAWKVKKTLAAKYRPDDVLTVSELKRRLNNVTLKGNQVRSDLFEELVAIEHAYSETAATLGTQDLIGAVFAAAPGKYHTVLNITSYMKGKALDIDDLEKVMYNLWRQGGGNPTADNKEQ
jgi:hypothetical protein